MIRRVAVAVFALVAVVSLSSCSTFDHRDAVATVNGHDFTRDDLEAALRNRIVQDSLSIENDGSNASTASAAGFIGYWVALQAYASRYPLDQTAVADATKTLADKYPNDWPKTPAAVQLFLIRYTAVTTAGNAGKIDQATLVNSVKAAKVHVDSRYGYWDAAKLSVGQLT